MEQFLGVRGRAGSEPIELARRDDQGVFRLLLGREALEQQSLPHPQRRDHDLARLA